MIQIIDKQECCGCEACSQVCPTGCITMREDHEGFLYPNVNIDQCIECDRCEAVCPVTSRGDEREPLRVLGAKNRDEQVRAQSSSGGVFSLLAQSIIEQGGIVIAARYDENWEVVHTVIQSVAEIEQLRGSKYMQSCIGESYNEVKRFLKSGSKVLFCGTPCQVAALKLSLGEGNIQGLLTVDFVCHGTPSPKVWRYYLRSIVPDISTIRKVNFRDKSRSWNDYRFTVTTKDQTISQRATENIFMRGFFQDLFLRPACYHCPSKCACSGSDITLGDFWGVERLSPKFADKRGVSLLMIGTQHGLEAIESLNLEKIEAEYSSVVKHNPSIVRSAKLPEERGLFFSKIDSDMTGELERLTYIPPSRRVILEIKKGILKLLPLSIVEWLERRKRV